MVVCDSPYNVKIAGHVSGLGKVRHREFAMATGEMSSSTFTDFLSKVISNLAARTADGSIHFHFMDWRHTRELQLAADSHYSALLNIVVWDKGVGGMGSLYRSRHELVFVYKAGDAPHINNIQLGKHGRNRSNVWQYRGLAGFGKDRSEQLEAHPTAKPVAMIADAMRDCSKRGGIILDPFGGFGSTMIAAERTGRLARLIEIDPTYVDRTVRRWQRIAKDDAINAQNRPTPSPQQNMRRAPHVERRRQHDMTKTTAQTRSTTCLKAILRGIEATRWGSTGRRLAVGFRQEPLATRRAKRRASMLPPRSGRPSPRREP